MDADVAADPVLTKERRLVIVSVKRGEPHDQGGGNRATEDIMGVDRLVGKTQAPGMEFGQHVGIERVFRGRQHVEERPYRHGKLFDVGVLTIEGLAHGKPSAD
jgi:hypothetical protein